VLPSTDSSDNAHSLRVSRCTSASHGLDFQPSHRYEAFRAAKGLSYKLLMLVPWP
jgi:hypothetical protein